MIYGIGTDICDVRRIRSTYERHGERFVRRILSVTERMEWQRRSQRNAARGIQYLATRFSVKEAFSKAIGLGMRMPMTWRSCEVGKLPGGKPTLVLYGALSTWFTERGLSAHVTLSDEADYAVSFVVVECDAKSA